MKDIKIYDNKNKKIVIGIITAFVLLLIVVFICRLIIAKQVKQSVVTISADESKKQSEIEWLSEENEDSIDINDILKQNLNEKGKAEIETQVVDLEYETEYKENDQLVKGSVKVIQQGKDGKQELIIKKVYSGDEVISDEQIGRKIIEPCINKIVEVGTASGTSKHTIKVGDIVYSTPDDLELKKASNKNSDVVVEVSRNSELKVLKKSGKWYYVEFKSYKGWVEEDCITYINPKPSSDNNSKPSKLSKNMNLMKPSGLTLEQFKKILSNNSQDKNKIFEKNAEYFYYAEKQYGINGVFVAAIGIHESAWGTSKIAQNKKNLFGYGAYDKSAYSSAYSYDTYAASIDMIARVLVKYYLNEKGTSIYNGEKATGQYYNGKTLEAVNKKYATDKKWYEGVYNWMEYLYNKV